MRRLQPYERVLLKSVKVETGCWLYTGTPNTYGYGQMRLPCRDRAMVHRLIYESFVGPIPEGWTIDHLCRVRNCVNPAHLEAVTVRENTLRGVGPSAKNARKTHCIHDHELTGDNLILSKEGFRRCRECRRIRGRRYLARRIAKKNEAAA